MVTNYNEVNPILHPLVKMLVEMRDEISAIKTSGIAAPVKRIPFPDYCKQENITRPTGYKRAEKGLIELEKIGGRQYVRVDSITLVKKYQREPQAA